MVMLLYWGKNSLYMFGYRSLFSCKSLGFVFATFNNYTFFPLLL